jgi:hypothetical protein
MCSVFERDICFKIWGSYGGNYEECQMSYLAASFHLDDRGVMFLRNDGFYKIHTV